MLHILFVQIDLPFFLCYCLQTFYTNSVQYNILRLKVLG